MRLDKIIARGRIVDLKSLDLEGALQELLDVCVEKFPDLKPEALLKSTINLSISRVLDGMRISLWWDVAISRHSSSRITN
jgi:hypothetical protein